MNKLGSIDYMKTLDALSNKNCDIQYASAEMKRFAQMIFDQAIAERDEARRLAEEWRDHSGPMDYKLPWEVVEGQP